MTASKGKKKKRTRKEVENWFRNRNKKPTRFIYKSDSFLIHMKSSWEVRYAYWLDSQNIKWHYEPWGINTIIGYYFPDFYIPAQEGIERDEYHEVKGRLTKTAATKMNNFRKLYPDTPLKVIGAKEMKNIPNVPDL